jgi:hypothetical protein
LNGNVIVSEDPVVLHIPINGVGGINEGLGVGVKVGVTEIVGVKVGVTEIVTVGVGVTLTGLVLGVGVGVGVELTTGFGVDDGLGSLLVCMLT